MAFISVKKFAELYGLPMDKAYQMSRAKGFPAFRLGRKVQIDEVNVRAWIEKQYGNVITKEGRIRKFG